VKYVFVILSTIPILDLLWASSDKPAKTVQFDSDRDMHKGFLNIVLKSFFAGIKQTLISSGKEKPDKNK